MRLNLQDLNDGVELVTVQRYEQHSMQQQSDEVVQESPIALVYNGISHAVMMATPQDLVCFAKGFSLSEGILDSLQQLYALEIRHSAYGIEVEMQIASRAFSALKQHRRMLIGATGCGLCGIESLQQLGQQLPVVTHRAAQAWYAQIPSAIAQLKAQQRISQRTGGAHAAAWVVQGQIVALFEDVGRHNALDKLLGYLAEQQYDRSQGFVVMTSRASYELIRKCAYLNIALIACISAPTSLAIQMAQSAGIHLAGFCRGEGFVVYNRAE
ncbi:FdhD protein [Acinetobacter calcoaceticus]|uniref:Sulfur carrier protein FdhD n=1 Tax=Acinetobacter calcoaceticus TaxID=471 RepID=A0A4R1XU17_ACICA|nr:FdhD protein [Acinetobacter calcoaceticus]